MVDKEHAIEVATKLFTRSHSLSEVQNIEANRADTGWGVVFNRPAHPEFVETPNFWLITVSETGQAKWFDVM